MKFYNWSGSPSPRRARMFIAEKGIEIDTIEINLAEREQFTPEFLAINPRATAPVLVTENGFALTENIGIAAYLEDKFPNPPLMGTNAQEKGAVLMWNAICETQGFLVLGDYFRNINPGHKGRAVTGTISFEQIPELAKRSRHRADLFFHTLEDQLAKTEYLASDKFTVADITGFVVCEFARLVNISIPEDCVKTQAWYDKILTRSSAKV